MATQPVEESRHLALVPQSPAAEKFALMQRQAKTFAMSMLVPQHLRQGPPEQALANCYIALTLAEAMGEMPLIVMQNIHVINGKAGFASKYMIARANASGKFADDLDWDISGEGKSLAATCFATLAKSGKRVQMKVDMAMAEAEGWTKNAKYRTMPELMLRYRSASFLVNLYAPEVMLGYRTVEDIEDVNFATVPATSALTADMLIDQSKPAETIDAETGEIEAIDAEVVAAEPAAAETDQERRDDTASDLSPAEQYLAKLRERIAGAPDKLELKKADADWTNNRVAYDGDQAVLDEIDGLIVARRRALQAEG